MPKPLALILLLLLAACRPGPAPAPGRPATPARDAEAPRRVLSEPPITTLDELARCFHRAVTLLQAEPAAGETLSAFLAKAQQRAAGPLHTCFAGVQRDASGAVVVGAGARVTMTRGEPSHSSYAGGRTELATPYRFTATGVTGSGTAMILRSFGGAP